MRDQLQQSALTSQNTQELSKYLPTTLSPMQYFVHFPHFCLFIRYLKQYLSLSHSILVDFSDFVEQGPPILTLKQLKVVYFRLKEVTSLVMVLVQHQVTIPFQCPTYVDHHTDSQLISVYFEKVCSMLFLSFLLLANSKL